MQSCDSAELFAATRCEPQSKLEGGGKDSAPSCGLLLLLFNFLGDEVPAQCTLPVVGRLAMSLPVVAHYRLAKTGHNLRRLYISK